MPSYHFEAENPTSLGRVLVPAESIAPVLDETVLPEWRLEDLYASIDAPELVSDLTDMQARCEKFEDHWKGKLG